MCEGKARLVIQRDSGKKHRHRSRSPRRTPKARSKKRRSRRHNSPPHPSKGGPDYTLVRNPDVLVQHPFGIAIDRTTGESKDVRSVEGLLDVLIKDGKFSPEYVAQHRHQRTASPPPQSSDPPVYASSSSAPNQGGHGQESDDEEIDPSCLLAEDEEVDQHKSHWGWIRPKKDSAHYPYGHLRHHEHGLLCNPFRVDGYVESLFKRGILHQIGNEIHVAASSAATTIERGIEHGMAKLGIHHADTPESSTQDHHPDKPESSTRDHSTTDDESDEDVEDTLWDELCEHLHDAYHTDAPMHSELYEEAARLLEFLAAMEGDKHGQIKLDRVMDVYSHVYKADLNPGKPLPDAEAKGIRTTVLRVDRHYFDMSSEKHENRRHGINVGQTASAAALRRSLERYEFCLICN